MYLGDQLNADYLDAQKRRDMSAMNVLRQLRSAFHNAEIATRGKLDEAASIKFLQQQLRQREEAALAYRQAGRAEQLAQEESEAAIIKKYLPPSMPAEELKKIAAQAVAEAGDKGFGTAMALAMAKVKGQATGQEVSTAIKQAIDSKK